MKNCPKTFIKINFVFFFSKLSCKILVIQLVSFFYQIQNSLILQFEIVPKGGTENSVTETASLDSKGESDIANPVERTGIPKVTVQDHKKKLIVQVISLMRMAKPKILK